MAGECQPTQQREQMSQPLPVPWQASSFINSCTCWEPEWVEALASLTDSPAEPSPSAWGYAAHITPPPHQQTPPVRVSLYPGCTASWHGLAPRGWWHVGCVGSWAKSPNNQKGLWNTLNLEVVSSPFLEGVQGELDDHVTSVQQPSFELCIMRAEGEG